MSTDDRTAAARRWAGTPSHRGEIEPFIVMDVMRAANAREAKGERIIHMEVGQPSTPAPRLARQAAARALEADRLGYTDALGLPSLRARIARHYRDAYGLAIDPGRIVVTAGSSAGFVLAFLALFDPGARVALPSPGYPCYRHILTALGCEPVLMTTDAATRWMPTAELIAAADRDRRLSGVLVASPANPTGTMLTPERLAEITSATARLGIPFISDEIYHGLTYAHPATTALTVAPDAIVINSFSKYFSMTGYRIGWMVVPGGLVRSVERLAQNLYISPPTISQIAAEAAFDAHEELEGYKQVYVANREFLLDRLPKVGLETLLPADGAFYIYADVGHWTNDSSALAGRLLAEAGLAVTPGLDFDPARGARYVRLSYARSGADMAEAVKRLAAWRP